ncbi:MAG: hypothetical protein M3430_12395 [Acidobacteriota bacterium]|nr:hypothetical protein [Acidobacteriota bacterium]
MGIFQTLEFSQEWIDLGIVTHGKLKQIEAEWAKGDDRNTEHYRWRAFHDFIQSKETLDADTATALYDLGANDPDYAMGGAIMAEILWRKDCPKHLLESAATSERKHLRKIADRKLKAD